MVANRSYETDGTDDPTRQWLQRIVRVRTHPEWGKARVLRWYPASGGQPQRLRIMAEAHPAPQIVPLAQVEIVSDDNA